MNVKKDTDPKALAVAINKGDGREEASHAASY